MDGCMVLRFSFSSIFLFGWNLMLLYGRYRGFMFFLRFPDIPCLVRISL